MRSTLTLVTHSNKAVAVGAVSSYLDRFVTGRISRFTYGAYTGPLYDPSNTEHVKREHKSYIDPAGDKRVQDGFNNMLPRVCHPSSSINTP